MGSLLLCLHGPKTNLVKAKKMVSKTANAVELAEQFCQMSDALMSSVKEAYNCNDFVQFLDKSERGELRRYKRDMSIDDDDESTCDSE
jgi:hypothetical protein